MQGSDCVFCAIIAKKIPASIDFEDDDVIAFASIEPEAPVHTLVVPKKHIAKLSDIEETDHQLMAKIQATLVYLADKLGVTDGFKVVVNNGKLAGQVIFHLHYHLLGGFKKGGIK